MALKTGDLTSCRKANLKSWIIRSGARFHSDEVALGFGFRILGLARVRCCASCSSRY